MQWMPQKSSSLCEQGGMINSGRTERNYSTGVRMSISLGEKGKGRNQVVKMWVVFGEEETPWTGNISAWTCREEVTWAGTKSTGWAQMGAGVLARPHLNCEWLGPQFPFAFFVGFLWGLKEKGLVHSKHRWPQNAGWAQKELGARHRFWVLAPLCKSFGNAKTCPSADLWGHSALNTLHSE